MANIETEEDSVTLHPDFPIVEGTFKISEEWSVVLVSQFNRRTEEGDFVIWRPGFTIWSSVWGNDKFETQQERLAFIQEGSSPQAYDKITECTGGLVRYAYRLREESDDNREPAFYCFAIGDRGHVEMAIYFDAGDYLPDAIAIWRSLTEERIE